MVEEKHHVYVLGEFSLDVAQRELTHHGAVIRLASRPLQILVYLIERRNRLVTRAELLDQFWDGRDVYDDSLRKAIGAIRKALGDPSDPQRFIETRYGEGYRYIGPLIESATSAAPAAVEIERNSDVEIVIEEETHQSDASNLAFIPVQLSPASTKPRFRRPIALTFAVSLFALIGAALVSRHNSNRAEETKAIPIRSIAVLPLKNLSGGAGQEHFSDGMTESLINALAKVRDLKVIARNSAFAFKGKEVDVREIGYRLGVAAVLEGSLRRDAETVRVTVRLVSTEDGRVLWTGDTTRPLKEIVALQDEIGCSVAESLKTVLCRDPNHKPGTNNPAAYEAYLKGRDRRLKGDAQKAAEFFEQAVNADPNYALGWAGLAEACTVMEVNSQVPPRSLTGKAREGALKAIALDASLAAPYAALGLLSAFSDRDWVAGERYFQQALANNPNYAIAHAWYANTLMVQGKFTEAEAEYLRACGLDPLNPGFLNNLAETYHYWRQSDRCLEQAAKALELEPGNEWARLNQAKCYTQLGRYEEALQVPLASAYKSLMHLGIFALSGRQAEARELVPLVLKDYGQTSPYLVAITYAVLADKESSFAWLQKAADRQQADLVSLKIEPAFDGMRNDPRFAELVRRVGLMP